MIKLITIVLIMSIQTALACVPSQNVLEYNNAVTCNRQTGTKTIDFRFNTSQQILVKLKETNVMCAGKGTRYFFSWITFDASGKEISNVPFENEILYTPGGKQALRVNVLEPEKCGYFMLEFESDFV